MPTGEEATFPGGVEHLLKVLGAGGVSGTVYEWPATPVRWSKADLQAARRLPLSLRPVSPGAVDLTARITAEALRYETTGPRQLGRRAAGQAKLAGAVGAVVGGLLTAWGRAEPRASWRSLSADAFTGATVGEPAFRAVMDCLVSWGFVAGAAGVRFKRGTGYGETSHGLAARYRPTAALLALATGCGITPGSLGTDYQHTFSGTAPKVKSALAIRSLGEKRRGGRGAGVKRDIVIRAEDPMAAGLLADVEAQNAFAAVFDVRGCLPPRWRRVFTECWDLGGRFVALGADGAYQTLSKLLRSEITIDGHPTVEIDVAASHLSLMHGLLGLPLPPGDLYTAVMLAGSVHSGDAREVVKAWVLGTLGKGSPVRRWSADAPPVARAYGPLAIGAAIIAVYPFLQTPSAVVTGLADLGTPARLLPHKLMAVEATALTAAMANLRQQGVLALPVHDSLIVRADAADAACAALGEAYVALAGVRPRLTVNRGN
jgi:hypothetical protein